MNTVQPVIDRPPLGEPMSATEQLLNAKHADLMRDLAKLGELRDILTSKAKQEQDARDFIAYMESTRDLHAELERFVATNHDLLDSAAQRTDWQPPQDRPLPIGDGIGHDTLTTLGVPVVRTGELVEALVGKWVEYRHSGEQEIFRGWLAADTDGVAAILDGEHGAVAAKVPVVDIVSIREWVADPLMTAKLPAIPTGNGELKVTAPDGSPVESQHLERVPVTESPSGANPVVRTGEQPTVKPNGRGRRG